MLPPHNRGSYRVALGRFDIMGAVCRLVLACVLFALARLTLEALVASGLLGPTVSASRATSWPAAILASRRNIARGAPSTSSAGNRADNGAVWSNRGCRIATAPAERPRGGSEQFAYEYDMSTR